MFGDYSPVGVECLDEFGKKTITTYLDFYFIDSVEADLIERVLGFEIDFNEEEKEILDYIDKKLDMPVVGILFEKDISRKLHNSIIHNLTHISQNVLSQIRSVCENNDEHYLCYKTEYECSEDIIEHIMEKTCIMCLDHLIINNFCIEFIILKAIEYDNIVIVSNLFIPEFKMYTYCEYVRAAIKYGRTRFIQYLIEKDAFIDRTEGFVIYDYIAEFCDLDDDGKYILTNDQNECVKLLRNRIEYCEQIEYEEQLNYSNDSDSFDDIDASIYDSDIDNE